ncbi:LD-carboxypeptidase [Sediminibacterium sp.]|uniref:S66 peptidase family protein n=1 Tax=Sediminibacterium sp. TaxID=1917865 RepID=UPI0027333FB7|nr:LD-carboxypeptidase [Sediminibacterium sp.]MDP3567604.1 LD-carboxypeptidase [Sediminibacterium sp.]
MAITPSYLKKGDTILIIATARARSENEIKPSVEILKSWGLKVELGPNIFKKHHQFAGTDEERAADLQWAINHKTAKAILISGGGYGSLRIIDRSNFKAFIKNPKWFIGYSDTTVLHNRLSNLNIAAIHGTMAFQFQKNAEATLSIKKLLFGEKVNYQFPYSTLNRIGVAEAEIVGGNLSLLYALSGSVDDVSTKNKILFLEDLDEQLYHIDRMMLQLKRSGKLKHLKGLIVGGMSDMKDNAIPFGKTAEEIVLDAVKEYNYPVCFNFPAGHIEKNMAIYLGKKAKLSVTKSKVSLNYL